MYSAPETESLLRRFLGSDPGFRLNLTRYIESARYLDPHEDWLASFGRQFTAAGALPLDTRPGDELARATEGVAAYAGVDWTQPDPWPAIPLISRADLRHRGDDYVSDRYERSALWNRSTSGTTGRPVTILYAPEYYHRELHAAARCARVAGEPLHELRRSDVFCVALADRKGVGDLVWADPTGFQGLTLRPAFDESDGGEVARIAGIVRRHPPALLVLRPNVLRSILERAGPRELDAFGQVRLVLCSGSHLDGELRARAEELLRTRVCCAYGLTEVGVVASECEERCLHIYENDVFCEVLDADGGCSAEGAGELVASSILNRAMPLLRYRTGDVVEVTADPCACGMHGRRIAMIAGRTLRNFPLPDGSEVSPTVWDRLFFRYPIRECRVVQRRLDHIDLDVEFEPGCVDVDGQLERLRREVAADTRDQVGVRARAMALPSDPTFERYVCLVAEPPPRGLSAGPAQP